jgi:probable HAF family extracellular repeat protein
MKWFPLILVLLAVVTPAQRARSSQPTRPAATSPAKPRHPRSYRLVEIGRIDTGGSQFVVINDSGLVATRDTSGTAFTWKDGQVTLLPHLPGGDSATPLDINNKGEVVGWTRLKHEEAVLWKKGKAIPLDVTNLESHALAINDRSQISGVYEPEDGGASGSFLWEKGKWIDIGSLGGNKSRGADIAPNGIVVGSSRTAAGDTRAFIWKRGVMTELPAPAFYETVAGVISRSGVIAGTFQPPFSNDWFPFVYERGTFFELSSSPVSQVPT